MSTTESPPPLRLLYTNYKGETAWREVIPVRVFYGATEFHPEPGWLLEAFDVAKAAARTFALKDVHRVGG